MPPLVVLCRGVASWARSVVGGREAKQAKTKASVGGRFAPSACSPADPDAAGSGAVAALVSAGDADGDVQPIEDVSRDDVSSGAVAAMQPCDGPAGLAHGESARFPPAAVAVAGTIAAEGAALLSQHLRLAADDGGGDLGSGASRFGRLATHHLALCRVAELLMARLLSAPLS